MADDPESLMKRISAMQKALANFRIIGGEGVTVHGSMEHGYAVSVDGDGGGGAGGAGGGGGPATGACCIGTDCSILTSDDCATMGGTYLGDGAPCDPNPCTGISCCYPDGHCADEVSDGDCVAAGGQSFGQSCASQGVVPCCVVFHVTSHISGTVCHQDSCDVASCSQSVDLTANFDTFLQNSGNGCCGDLLTSNPIEIDAGGYHGVFQLIATDNFDGTFDLGISWQITVDACVVVTATATHNSLNCNSGEDFLDPASFCSPCIDCTGETCDCQCPIGDCGAGSACGTYYNFSIATSISI